MKGFGALILAVALVVGSANVANAQCCPVRKAAKRIVCVPVNVVRKVQEKKPVRATLCKIKAVRPVRKVLKKVACLGCCGCCGC